MLDHLKPIIKIISINYHSKNKKTTKKSIDELNSYPHKPKFSIIIPGYKADRINETIQSSIGTTYKNKEIIVVVNGDDKKTYDKAKYFEEHYPELVKIYYLKEKGKAKALNYGLKQSNGNYIITLDADSKITNPNSLYNIAMRFEDKDIIAMCGDIQIQPGDNCTKNIWTKLQAIEYLLTMHIGKRFQTIFNTMLIIPGGFAIFKRHYLLDSNPFDEKSIAEDFVISLNVHTYNKKIVFEPNATARFDCPDNYSKLNAQRTRWAYGQIETLKTYQNSLFSSMHSKLLRLAILNMWIFDVFINMIWIVSIFVFLPIILFAGGVLYICDTTENGEGLFTDFCNAFNSGENPIAAIIIQENQIIRYDIYDSPAVRLGPFNFIQWLYVLIIFYPILETISALYAIKISNRKDCYRLLWYVLLLVFIYRPFVLRPLLLKGHIKGLLRQRLSWYGEKRYQKRIIFT